MNLDETSGAFDEVENESVMVTSAEDIEDEDGGQPLVDPQDILDEEGEALEEAFDAAVDLEAIKEHYAETGFLSDLEMDAVADLSVSYLRQILACFGEGDATIDEYESDEGELILDVSEGDLAILIGRHGRTLEALQQLLSSLVNRSLGFHFPVIVDIEGYRERRRKKIRDMAFSAAEKAKRRHTAVSLSPMNAYERRLVHLALRSDDEVTTYSEGEDPDRYVVVCAVNNRE